MGGFHWDVSLQNTCAWCREQDSDEDASDFDAAAEEADEIEGSEDSDVQALDEPPPPKRRRGAAQQGTLQARFSAGTDAA